jgi:predicted Zn-dependent protease
MQQEVAAIVARVEGRSDQAVEALRAAATAESRLPEPLGLPTPIKPAPELLGEVLVEIGRPVEAIPFFEAALRRHPNRSLSVLGLARATKAAGQAEASRRYYRQLLANYSGADAGVKSSVGIRD